ncbi:LysR family transcriptional regulator [Acidihalobacter aeolianus]|uniref:LysR family transcriptional regulator n=1 Tax=Acidihalobacter aeolianus TaxID=2792603 RepID=A0A1D8K9P9_9GAMM|nr:LysR family transcriptional regulator [Acidihalobacter aeolianus]AOV17708.1 LysR family transcriptional regulator [Acidihalobacter aeolianus]
MSEARPRIRILRGRDIAIGPGKADLLQAIDATGSISSAARQMDMSYRRAWLLVDTMNQCFVTPLVDTAVGGSGGGGARLTPLGLEVLQRYRAMETNAAAAIADDAARLNACLKPLED